MNTILITSLLSSFFTTVSATDQPGGDHAEHEGPHIPGAGFSVLFIFGGLLFSGVAKTVLDKLNVV